MAEVKDETQAASTGPADGRPQHGGRLDSLDGLRTIAVFLVVLFHAEVPGFDGGFLGVDLFFVLSGYLITAGLVRGLLRGRGAGLSGFWARRFLRLLPAALLVILAVLVWTIVWAPAYRLPTLGGDLFSTVLYVANWHFIDTSGYFSNQGVPSPVLHMWSLAVEEQFYLLWPIVVALTWAVLARRGPVVARRGLVVVGSVLAVASAGWLTSLAASGLTDRAYMGSDAKAFEPLLGALVAVVLSRPETASAARRLATPLGWAGALTLVVLVPLLGDGDGPTSAYFRGGALAFSLAGAAVIVGLALGWVRGLSDALAWAPVSYLGRISYGIYLWHWPVTCWLLAEGGWSPERTAAIVGLSVVLASASYHLVEMPLRQGRAKAWLSTRRTLGLSGGVVALLALAIPVVGGTPLSPAVQRVVTLPGSTGESVVLVVGDSVPQRLLPELAAAAKDRGLTLVSATAGGCSPLAVHTLIAPGDTTGADCATKVPPKIDEALATYHPGTIIWWSRYELADRYEGATLLRAGTPAFWTAQRTALTERVHQLGADGAVTVFVETDRPGVGMASRCTPAKCHPFLRRLVDDDALRVQWNEVLRETAAADHATRVIGIDDVYCHDSHVPCDDRTAAGATVRADGSHFSDPTAKAEVAAALLDRVMAARRR